MTHVRPTDSDTVIVAALVSRVESLCVASMLEANGIVVHVDGSYHASAEVISLALGGHRLRIARADYQAASDLIREVGTDKNWTFSYSVQRAVLRLVAFWAAFLVPFSAASFFLNKEPSHLLLPVLAIASLPVNPQGSGDYFLAPAA